MKFWRKKKQTVLFALFLGLLAAAMPVRAAETYRNQWRTKLGHILYYDASGKRVAGIVTINGKTYGFNQKGYLVKSGWVRINGYKYRTSKTGRIRTGFVTLADGKTRYFGKDGKRKSGWQKINGSYYYFDLDTGVMVTGKRVDRVLLGKDGKARGVEKRQQKMDNLVRASQIAESITTPKMSREQKLRACFRWVIQKPYYTRRVFQMADKEWPAAYASDILNGKGGNCFSDAAAFAYLARAVGFEKVYACTDSGHAWTEIDGDVFDPLLAEEYTRTGKQADVFSDFYRISYQAFGKRQVFRYPI
ncbi:MAG: transglutaminase domain-containing protein [Candidatus Limivivens sp.]|nr:transglutaminase domain-containing protein [Candidatus Limivivens sp.]